MQRRRLELLTPTWQAGALPTTLTLRGRDAAVTPLLALASSQDSNLILASQWELKDSNLRPLAYQTSALTY